MMRNDLIPYIRNFGVYLTCSKICSKFLGRNFFLPKLRSYLFDNVFRYLDSNYYCDTNGSIGNDSPIWFMWWQDVDNMPELIRATYNNRYRYSLNRPVVLITKNNFSNYAPDSNYIYNQLVINHRISITHFSDYLRCELLYRHGGIWLDSTILMTSTFDDWVSDSSFFTIKKQAVANNSHIWTTYCLGSKRHSSFFKYILDFYNLYYKKYNTVIDYYLFDEIINLGYSYFPSIKQLIDSIPVNNVNALDAVSHLNDLEDEYVFPQDTYLYKLTWKNNFIKNINSKNTVYGKIISDYLGEFNV